jgi:hypothetical protein
VEIELKNTHFKDQAVILKLLILEEEDIILLLRILHLEN